LRTTPTGEFPDASGPAADDSVGMSGAELTPTALSVLIVDPHEVSRAAIRALLQTEGLEVVADVATGEQALAVAGEQRADVVIIDIGQDAPRALALAEELTRSVPLLTIVLTSSTSVEGGTDGHPFVAKPDICARELRVATQSRNPQNLGGRRCR
jgi:CheY-like chemotaxis protein